MSLATINGDPYPNLCLTFILSTGSNQTTIYILHLFYILCIFYLYFSDNHITTIVILLYPLKTIENVKVLFCFMGYENVKMGRNGLKHSRDTKLWKMLSYFD